MSIVRHQPIKQNTPPGAAKHIVLSPHTIKVSRIPGALFLCAVFIFLSSPTWANQPPHVNQEALLATITEYAHAVGKNDRVAAGQRDFVCLMKMAQQQSLVDGQLSQMP